MWGSVLMLAILTAPDPVRLGVTVLLISRPKAMQNLLAYWGSAMLVSVCALVVPLLVLRFTPMLRTWTQSLATAGASADATVGHVRIGMGVLAFLIATLIMGRFAARERTLLPTPASNTSTLVIEPQTSTEILGLLRRGEDVAKERATIIRRLLTRAHYTWESGSLWVALVVGFGSATPPLQALVVLTPIVASGAAIGTQISAAIVFVIGTLAIVETVLVSYLAKPVKTLAALRLLHDWVRPRRRQVLAAILAVAGASLLASGIASI
jgi:hypothetical protein